MNALWRGFRSGFCLSVFLVPFGLTGCAGPNSGTGQIHQPYEPDWLNSDLQSSQSSAPGGEETAPIGGLDLDQYVSDLAYLEAHKQKKLEANQASEPDPIVTGQRERPRTVRADIIWMDSNDAPQAELTPNKVAAQQHTDHRTESVDGAVKQDEIPAVHASAQTQGPPILNIRNVLPQFKGQLARAAADSKQPLRERLVTAALLLITEDQPIDPALLYDMNESDREIFAAYQAHFADLRALWDRGASTTEVRQSAQDFLTELAPSPQLALTNFRLCRQVTNFGLYDEIETASFPSMRATPLLTYVEIENFHSTPAADGIFVTRLRHELELYTEHDGTVVYTWPALPAEDRCGRIRRDFFLPRQITLPANLSNGRYRLKIRITDEQSQEQAEAVIPISIVAGSNWARSGD